jgi:hypothetical protein
VKKRRLTLCPSGPVHRAAATATELSNLVQWSMLSTSQRSLKEVLFFLGLLGWWASLISTVPAVHHSKLSLVVVVIKQKKAARRSGPLFVS